MINPHIINSSSVLDSFVSNIESAVEMAENYVVSKLNILEPIDIVFHEYGIFSSVILEDGIGGRTETSSLVRVSLDTDKESLDKDIIFETICHELCHVARWQKNSEYSTTLLDTLIFEGLATVFEETALIDNHISEKQYFLSEIINRNTEEDEKILALLKKDLDNGDYDYYKIFFDGDDALPKWSGYSLGYYLVKKYLSNTNQKIEEVFDKKYSEIKKGVIDTITY